MIKSIRKIAAKTAAVGAMLWALPLWVYAQTDVNTGLGGIGGLFPQTGVGASRSPIQLIGNIISLLLFVAGAIAVVFVIIGGFLYMTSAGNAEQAEKGQQTLTNAIIGIVIVILSYVIINVVVNFVSGGVGYFGLE